MRVFDNITRTIGKTPLVKLNRLGAGAAATIFAKLEFFNPTSSVKDRIAVNMVDDAERRGELKPGGMIVEPTSGNTGTGLAMVAAARGYKLVITMPETMSVERRQIMRRLGAEVLLTPGETGMAGAIAKAEEIQKATGAFMPRQFSNPANPETHRQSTGPEIWDDLDGKVDAFVAGVGTGGTLTGAGSFLKAKNPALQVVAVEPSSSAVLSGKAPGRHAIQGIGAGFVPEVLDTKLIDRVVAVSDHDAVAATIRLGKEEGILCGISSGAAAFAAAKLANEAKFAGKNIVVLLPDTGERYLSSPLFNDK